MKKTVSFLLVGLVDHRGGRCGPVRDTVVHPARRDRSMHAMTASARAEGLTRSDLRQLLGRLLGEHAVLAMSATNLGVTGSPTLRPRREGARPQLGGPCRSRSPRSTA